MKRRVVGTFFGFMLHLVRVVMHFVWGQKYVYLTRNIDNEMFHKSNIIHHRLISYKV